MTYLTNTSQTSTSNSSSSTLTANSVFTGTSEIVQQYSSVTVYVYSDVDSAPSGLKIQFSSDGTNWDITKTFSFLTSYTYFQKSVEVFAKYFRIIYTNGTVDQSSFRLQTILNATKYAHEMADIYQERKNDAFGRVRVSNPMTIFDLKHVYGKNNQLEAEKITNSVNATASAVANQSSIRLTVSGNGDSVIRQTRKYLTYQPGKSLLIMCTGVLSSGSNASTVTSQIGFYDSNNGIYFKYVNSVLSIVLRTYTSGTVDSTTYAIPQSSWNIDKMDGTTNSGINIDVTKIQIFVFDFQWLGAGLVRCGLVSDGKITYAHAFHHANIISHVYMTTATLPIRYEISSTSGSGSMDQVCSTCISEGGYTPIGRLFCKSRGTTSITIASGTEVPLVTIRLNSSYIRATAVPVSVNVFISTNDNVLVRLRLFRGQSSSPVTTGTSFSSSTDSYVDCDIGSSSITTTGSVVIASYYISQANRTELSNIVENTNAYLSADVDGNPDYLSLTATNITGSSFTSYGTLSWLEYD